MTTYTETTKTWGELTIDQRHQVARWFRNDEITMSPLGVPFIVDDTGAVVGATVELD